MPRFSSHRSVVTRTALLLALATLTASFAGAYTLGRVAFSGGATDATGGGVRLQATLAEAGPVGFASGGGLQLVQGFWVPYPGLLDADTPETPLPGVHAMRSAHPNPFRAITQVPFAVSEQARVRLVVHDVAGRQVRELVDRAYAPGWYEVAWDGRDDRDRPVRPGVYYLSAQIGSFTDRRKLLRVW